MKTQTTPPKIMVEPIPIRQAITDHLKLSIPSGYRLVNSGVLKTYKVGKLRFTTSGYINECIEKLTAKTAGGAA